jgi:hypothetical protein
MNDFEDRKYVIFDISELGTINFEEVLETSADTCRKSNDLSNVVVKWNTDAIPSSIESLTTKSVTYSQSEILEILSGTAWSPKLYEET